MPVLSIKNFKIYQKLGLLLITIVVGYFVYNSIIIYNYSFEYSEEQSDVAIVLGAGTSNGEPSPIFRERINHGIYLLNKNVVKKIILTGGHGDGQKFSDSEIAKQYLQGQGIPESMILLEKKSRYTIGNLRESSHIMDSLHLKTALLVSDPLHMKRSMALAQKFEIDCKPSPTTTSMYQSTWPRFKSLMYETFYYSLGEVAGKHAG